MQSLSDETGSVSRSKGCPSILMHVQTQNQMFAMARSLGQLQQRCEVHPRLHRTRNIKCLQCWTGTDNESKVLPINTGCTTVARPSE